MKKQLKSLLTLIAIMFSISYLHAQCPGNKVQMYKPTHSGCISKCVSPNRVDHYISLGWLYYCPNSGGWGLDKTTEKTNNEILSNAKQETEEVILTDTIWFSKLERVTNAFQLTNSTGEAFVEKSASATINIPFRSIWVGYKY